jgi:zinc transporter ZupT
MCAALGLIFFVENIFTSLVVFFGEKRKQRRAKKHDVDNMETKTEPITTGGIAAVAIEASMPDEVDPSLVGCQECEAVSVQQDQANAQDACCQPEEPAKQVEEEHDDQHHGHSHSIDGSVLQGAHSPGMRFFIAVILWLSIAMHALFEGLGLGTETHESTMWSIFAAIISHKMVESFTIGLIITKGFAKVWVAIIFAIAYAVMSPTGIAIGIALSSADPSDSLTLAQGFILSVAAGAFIHVALFEILFHQPQHAILRAIRYCLFILGFAVMAVLAVWA